MPPVRDRRQDKTTAASTAAAEAALAAMPDLPPDMTPAQLKQMIKAAAAQRQRQPSTRSKKHQQAHLKQQQPDVPRYEYKVGHGSTFLHHRRIFLKTRINWPYTTGSLPHTFK